MAESLVMNPGYKPKCALRNLLQNRMVLVPGTWQSNMHTRRGFSLLLALGVLLSASLHAQDPLRFETEVGQLKLRNDSLWDQSQATLVFTGSSSIRMWEDLLQRFPGKQILNTGFGGSQASDLIFYLKPLVLDYRPEQVFIYEGDNDLAEGKRPGKVLRNLKEISARIHETLPGTSIVFISAKPSLSRWKLRGKYRRFNRKLLRWTRRSPKHQFADVWEPMLEDRQINSSLFIEDGLHMNSKGYDIWEAVLLPFLETKPNPPE